MTQTKTLKIKKMSFKDFSFSSFLLSIAIIVVMILILVSPVRYADSVITGLKLFFKAVLPGLLPFMFLTKLLTEFNVIGKLSNKLNVPINKLLGINGSGFYAFIMSAISGYPIGSKITADLYLSNQINEQQLTKTALISSTSGPIFVIGAVGGVMLKNIKAGVLIYISNILATLIFALLNNAFTKNKTKNNILNNNLSQNSNSTKSNNILYTCAKDTVIGLLIVGFYIALFSLFIDLLKDLKIITTLSYPLRELFALCQINTEFAPSIMSGIVEMTNGANMLSNTISPLSISLISFLIAFSGLSIIMQSLSFLNKTPIKAHKFILGKLAQAIISFIICMPFCLLFL